MTRIQPLRLRAPGRDPQPEASAPAARWSREWLYFAFVIATWNFAPLLRRLIDFRNGAFNPVSLASLLPFLALLPLVFVCLKKERLARLTPVMRICIYIWCGTFLYGFLTAAAFGSFGAAAFEMFQYLVPMLAGIWLAGQGLPITETFRRLAIILLPWAGIVAVYGILQWISPPPWDVLWVEGGHFTAADQPVPFAMRIFSTLNSPGTAADYCAVTMIFALPFLRFRSVWMWPLLAALGGALMLTLVREAWVALVVGALAFLVLSPNRLRAAPPLAVFGFVLVLLMSALPVFLGSGANSDVITSRLSTLGDVGHDASAIARQGEISDALAQGLSNPIGAGLGNMGAAARLSSNAETGLGNVLDSGYLARLLELGWLGFIGYCLVVIGGPIALLYGLRGRGRDAAGERAKIAGATAIAMMLALAWGDAASDAHLGLEGLFFWLAMGLGSVAVASRGPVTAPAPAQPVFGRMGRAL